MPKTICLKVLSSTLRDPAYPPETPYDNVGRRTILSLAFPSTRLAIFSAIKASVPTGK